MKFNVRDENGKEYKVEEVEEVKKTGDEDETKKRFPQETCRHGRQALRSC